MSKTKIQMSGLFINTLQLIRKFVFENTLILKIWHQDKKNRYYPWSQRFFFHFFVQLGTKLNTKIGLNHPPPPPTTHHQELFKGKGRSQGSQIWYVSTSNKYKTIQEVLTLQFSGGGHFGPPQVNPIQREGKVLGVPNSVCKHQ